MSFDEISTVYTCIGLDTGKNEYCLDGWMCDVWIVWNLDGYVMNIINVINIKELILPERLMNIKQVLPNI